MTDDVKVDAKAIGNNPDLQTLADEQQQCLAEYYGKIDNLRDAVRFMGSATFRGTRTWNPWPEAAESGWNPWTSG